MGKITERVINSFQNNNLFVKIFLVMVVSIVTVAVFITFSTIRMSGNLFLETFSITNTKVLNQVKSRFEDYSYAVVTTMNDIQKNGTIKRVITEESPNSLKAAMDYYSVIEQMNQIYANVDYYDTNMIVVGKNEHLFNMNYAKWPVSYEELMDHPITKNAIEQPSQLLFQFDPATDGTMDQSVLVASKALWERFTGELYGVLYITIAERNLKQFYQNFTSVGNDILLLNQTGTIVSSNRVEMIGTKALDILHYAKDSDGAANDSKEVEVLGEDYILLAEYLPTYNMYLVNLIDKGIVVGDFINPSEIIMISLGIALIAVLIVFLISRRMTKSITRLTKQISDMAKYNFNKPVSESGGYEARQIAGAFNKMLFELQDYVDIVVQTQKRQRKAELQSLQHQINPHFLYNTLTSVKFLVQQDQKEKATETIHALISLLQTSLGNINQTITVEQEFENIKNYVFINQTRYGDQIKVNYFISPDCMNYYLPKLIIQPFIENAFFHAFTNKKEGYIQILIARKEDTLVCEVVDNGDGMNIEDKLRSKKTGKRHLFSGIGLRNVDERIQLLYGKEYGVEVTSELGIGTRVKITLPILDQQEPE